MKQKTPEKDCEGQKGRINGKEHNNPSDAAGRGIPQATKERPQANGEARL
jgi:hypothetical protein